MVSYHPGRPGGGRDTSLTASLLPAPTHSRRWNLASPTGCTPLFRELLLSVGMIFQDDALLAHRDILGNVLLPVFLRFGTEDIKRASAIIHHWRREPQAGLFPHQLSGGMRKRLAMAREWFQGASVPLLD